MTVPIKRIAGFCLQKWLILNFILTYRQTTHSEVHLNEQIQGFAIGMHPLRREKGGRILRKGSLRNSVTVPSGTYTEPDDVAYYFYATNLDGKLLH